LSYEGGDTNDEAGDQSEKVDQTDG
jgi:hypothetical protein